MPSIHIDEETTVFTMDFAKTKGVWPRPAPAPATPATIGGGASVSSGALPPIGGAAVGAKIRFPPWRNSSGRSERRTNGEREGLHGRGSAEGGAAEVVEQAKTAKLEKVDRIAIRLFEYGDAFKLIPVANTINGTKRSITLSGSFITAQDSEMQFEFKVAAQDASTMKDYLEPQFRAAKETDLKTGITFDFDGGLTLGGDAPDKFIERLTRFASAAAYVEATAEVK